MVLLGVPTVSHHPPPVSPTLPVSLTLLDSYPLTPSPGPIRGSPFTANFSRNVPKTNNRIGGPLVIERMVEDLRALSKLTSTTLDGLNTSVAEGDREALIRVKEHLANVSEKDGFVNLTIDRCRAILAWLEEKDGVHVRATRDPQGGVGQGGGG